MDLCTLTKQLWEKYLSTDFENYGTDISVVDPECVMIGTGENEIFRGDEELLEFVKKIRSSDNRIPFKHKDLWCEELKIDEKVSMVYGGTFLWWEMTNIELQKEMRIEMDMRFTMIYRKDGQQWRLVHMHQSVPAHRIRNEKQPHSSLSLEIKNVQNQVQELQKLVGKDSLTELNNLRTLENIYRQKDQSGSWLVVVDVDNFKRVNDTYGHVAGNQLLKKIADILHSSVRNTDTVSRIGGDEFAILFGEMPSETINRRLQLIMDKIAKLVQCADELKGISMGATRIRQEENMEMALKRADEAMYQTKKKGKNGFTIL